LEGRTLVLGDGGWGTALALALHRRGRPVVVWSHDAPYADEVSRRRENRKFLPGVPIPAGLRWTGDLDEAVEGAGCFLSVVPTQFLRATLERFGTRLASLPPISATKGLERGTLERPSQVVREVRGGDAPVAVLSGPSHAEEVARNRATSVVVASPDRVFALPVQELLGSPALRLYTSEDGIGVELGGGLKNIIAVAAGITDGLGLGDNAKAALVSRGLMEMARYGHACGARFETFFGLSGAGDLMVTCYSRHSRNRALGERIGRGETLEEVLASTEKVAEGVSTCRAIHEAAGKRKVDMPITAALHAILFESLPPHDAVAGLMHRPARPEMDPIG